MLPGLFQVKKNIIRPFDNDTTQRVGNVDSKLSQHYMPAGNWKTALSRNIIYNIYYACVRVCTLCTIIRETTSIRIGIKRSP